MKWIIVATTAWTLLVSESLGASIGLFSTPDCSSCNLTVLSTGTATMYIRALTDGLHNDLSFNGAAFKVVGLPTGWSAISTPTPEATLSLGDPLGPDGASIAFGSSVPGTCIPLYTVTLLASGPVADVTLQVVGRGPAGDPDFGCPRFYVLCAGPCDVVYCVSGGSLLLNSERNCSVAVEARTWMQVKSLYR